MAKFDPVEYNELKIKLSLMDRAVGTKILPEYVRMNKLSEIVGRKIQKVFKKSPQDDNRYSIILVFTDKTWIPIHFYADGDCEECGRDANVLVGISVSLGNSFSNLIDTGILCPDAIAEYLNLQGKIFEMEKLKDKEKEDAIEREERELLAKLKAKYENS